MTKPEHKTHEAEVNFTDADRACPKDMLSAREKGNKDLKALNEVSAGISYQKVIYILKISNFYAILIDSVQSYLVVAKKVDKKVD